MSVEAHEDHIAFSLDDGEDPLDMMWLGIMLALEDGPKSTLQIRRKIGLKTYVGRRKLSARLARARKAGQIKPVAGLWALTVE